MMLEWPNEKNFNWIEDLLIFVMFEHVSVCYVFIGGVHRITAYIVRIPIVNPICSFHFSSAPQKNNFFDITITE